MLLGRSLRDVLFLLCQAIILIVIAIPFGLRVDPPAIVLTLALLALIGLALSPFSYTLGLITKSEDALAPAINTIIFPILLLAGILLPMSLAPDWLRTLANFNPFAHAVDAARALFNGDMGNPEIVLGTALMAILAVICLQLGARAFSRAVA
jgi:ABC-2 type transport system permease protein